MVLRTRKKRDSSSLSKSFTFAMPLFFSGNLLRRVTIDEHEGPFQMAWAEESGFVLLVALSLEQDDIWFALRLKDSNLQHLNIQVPTIAL